MMKASYRRSFQISLIIHVLIFGYFMIAFDFSSHLKPYSGKPEPKIVEATSIQSSQVTQEVARLKEERVAKQRAQAARLRALAQKTEQENQRALEQKKALAHLKAQQQQMEDQAKKELAALKQQQLKAKEQLNQIQRQTELAKQAKLKALETAKKQAVIAQTKKDTEDLLNKELLQEEKQLNANRANYVNSLIEKYKNLIVGAIAKQWLVPGGTPKDLSCVLHIELGDNGKVLNVTIAQTSGNAALDRSAVLAVYKASPLPVPPNPDLLAKFKSLNLKVRPETILTS